MQISILSTKRHWLGFFLLLALIAALVSGCSAQPSQSDTNGMNMAPLASMPTYVQEAPVSVQQAYQFALANPDVLNQVPCYCGCGAIGHASNYACYISGQNTDGSLSFDSHALGCSICVDITQDTMRLLKQGKSVPAVSSYIDSVYAKFGPSNMP
jgi:hypothetical protein